MKKIVLNTIAIFGLLLMVNCQQDNFTFGSLDSPTELKVAYDIIGKTDNDPNGDGSGKVKFTATAKNAISYKFIFPDGTFQNSTSGVYTKIFAITGLNTYDVVILASGKGGLTTSTTVKVQVLSDFKDPEAVTFLTGNSIAGKKWYWAKGELGHIGVGQNSPDQVDKNTNLNYAPSASYYIAPANGKSSTCLYNSVMTFSLDGSQMKFSLDNKGDTYFNVNYLGVVGGSGKEDNCFPYNTGGVKNVFLSPSESYVTKNKDHLTQTRATMINISGGGFMGYYIGQSSYEILSITENRMVVRAVMGNDPTLAWYHTFTSIDPNAAPAVEVDYKKLVFEDNFDVDGAPNATKWGYDLGAGGWGNSEEQNYTSAAENVIVQGGNLKITAKKVGSGYTSTRLKSENKFEFKYGKIEVRAKLSTGAGVWPAIWMLGEDYATNTWPACGEIDIMEQKGAQPNVIYGTLHYPGNSGANADGKTTTITNAASEFHVYKAIWSPSSIQIFVDDRLFHTVMNKSSIPFNKDFFLILNVAMGGTFGGAIDPAFTQSTMDIDYVRVYQ